MKNPLTPFAIVASALLVPAYASDAPADAAAPEPDGKTHVQTGVLSCKADAGWGYVVTSSRDLYCEWKPNKDTTYKYVGELNQYGADVGYHRATVLYWAVVDATHDVSANSMVGTYGGATAQAAVGLGAGASLLVGGFKNSVTLQPLAVSAEAGFDAVAAVQTLTLKPAPENSPS